MGALGEGECSDQGQNTALQRQKLSTDSGHINTRASRLVLSEIGHHYLRRHCQGRQLSLR